MRKISDFWVRYYLDQLRSVYDVLMYNHKFTEKQKDMIRKKIQYFKDGLDNR